MEDYKTEFSGESDPFGFNPGSDEGIITPETTLEDIEKNIARYLENDLYLESDLLTMALKKVGEKDSDELKSIFMTPGVREKLRELGGEHIAWMIKKIREFKIDEKNEESDEIVDLEGVNDDSDEENEDENGDESENDDSLENNESVSDVASEDSEEDDYFEDSEYVPDLNFDSIRERWGGRKTLNDVVRERIKNEYGLDYNDLKDPSEENEYERIYREKCGRVEDYVELLSREYLDDIIEICDGDGDMKSKLGKVRDLLVWISPYDEIPHLYFQVSKKSDGCLGDTPGGLINLKMTKNEYEKGEAIFCVETLVHEFWHDQQHMAVNTGKSTMSEKYAKDNYVDGKVDYFGYRATLAEKEAFYAGDIVSQHLLDRYFDKHNSDEKRLYYDYFNEEEKNKLEVYEKYPHMWSSLNQYMANRYLPVPNDADQYFEINTMTDMANYWKYMSEDVIEKIKRLEEKFVK